MNYLLDTNVLDELKHLTSSRSRAKRRRPNEGVMRFFASVSDDSLFVPAQVLGELYFGAVNARRQGNSGMADEVEAFASAIDTQYSSRVKDFDLASVKIWVTAHQSGNGGDPHLIDKQIAAMGIRYDMTIVTRDIKPNRGLNCPAWGVVTEVDVGESGGWLMPGSSPVRVNGIGKWLTFGSGLILFNPFSDDSEPYIPTMAA